MDQNDKNKIIKRSMERPQLLLIGDKERESFSTKNYLMVITIVLGVLKWNLKTIFKFYQNFFYLYVCYMQIIIDF